MMNIYKTDLGCLRQMKTLIFERCHLDIFAPRELSETLTNISLEGNKLDRLDVQFGADKDDFLLAEV